MDGKILFSKLIVLCILINCTNSNMMRKVSDCDSENRTVICKGKQLFSEDLSRIMSAKQSEDELFNKFLSRRLLHYLPMFDLRLPNGISNTCLAHYDKYAKSFSKLEEWALKIYDATAKPPSGLLNGNVNQLGDFDQCLTPTEGSAGIRGKYCLTSIQLKLESNSTNQLKTLHRLIHSHYAFLSDLEDSGHRVPRFSSANWAVCIPSGCTNEDVRKGVDYYLKNIFKNTDITPEVRIDESMCQGKDIDQVPWGTSFAMLSLGLIIFIVILATIYDHVDWSDHKNKYTLAFSLKNNVEKVFKTLQSKEDVKCVHGIRFLNSLMLIISHKSMALMFVPYINRTFMAKDIGKPWTVMSRAASLYTDPFIMFSGLLATYSILRKLRRNGKIAVVQEYISRLVRIMPPLGALILFCTWIMPWMSRGPLWNQVVTEHSHICRKYWWRNMLFIHNYFGFENICLTHTHHVGIDTQLFFMTPPVVLALWKYPRRTLQCLTVIALLSTVARYSNTYFMGLSNFVFYGTSVKQLFATADNMYILPFHRATVYIMGVALGYLLHHTKDHVLSKLQLRLGWAVTSSLFLLSFFAPAHMGSMHYVYSPAEAASYAAFAPIGWCSLFGWIIYTAQLGHNNWIIQLFSWRYYALWTKISYAVYLTQFPVFFYTIGVLRAPVAYDSVLQLIDIKELCLIIGSAIALTFFIEIPAQNIKMLLFSNPSHTKSVKVNTPVDEKVHKVQDIIEHYSPVECIKTK